MGAAGVCPSSPHGNAGHTTDRKTKVSNQINAHVFGLWEETPDWKAQVWTQNHCKTIRSSLNNKWPQTIFKYDYQ